jgi:hypothetical protein
MARILLLISFSLCFFSFEADAAATSVPHQLYGKSVTISRAGQQVIEDETAGKIKTVYHQMTDDFYISSQGRIFARRFHRTQFDSHTFEQIGSDPNKVQRPIHATGGGQRPLGTGVSTFQDFHFEGRTLIAIYVVGENAARKLAIEFDQNFGACTVRESHGTDDGKPVRRITYGHAIRVISGQATSKPSCVVRDGNIFE